MLESFVRIAGFFISIARAIMLSIPPTLKMPWSRIRSSFQRQLVLALSSSYWLSFLLEGFPLFKENNALFCFLPPSSMESPVVVLSFESVWVNLWSLSSSRSAQILSIQETALLGLFLNEYYSMNVLRGFFSSTIGLFMFTSLFTVGSFGSVDGISSRDPGHSESGLARNSGTWNHFSALRKLPILRPHEASLEGFSFELMCFHWYLFDSSWINEILLAT